MAGISTHQAKRRVLIAQFAGVALGVAAAGLWAATVWSVELPGLDSRMPQKPQVEDSGAGASKAQERPDLRIAREAPLGIAERLDIAANRPDKPEEPTATAPEAPPVTTEASRWKYLGPITEASRTLALVSLSLDAGSEPKQKIVSEGSRIEIKTPEAEGRPAHVEYRATVQKITPEYLEIDEDGRLRRVDLEGRTAKVTWIKNMPMTVAGAAGRGGNGALTAEARARLAAQGIDPQQIERARLAALQAAGRARGTPEAAANATAALANKYLDIQRGAFRGTQLDSDSSEGQDGTGADTKVVPMSDDARPPEDGVSTKRRVPAGVAN